LGFTKINSNDQLDLIGSCLSNCDGVGFVYNFTLFYSTQNFPLTSVQWIQFNLNSYYVTSGFENEKLMIKKQLFQDYPFVLWKVQLIGDLIISQNETSQGQSSKVFYVNYPPKNGLCDVNPKNGTTNDLFTLYCLNWIDSDGVVVEYVYYGKY
jgi:hypothetical protein